jgi:diguanylate cyclase (GGDEF)-like protein
MSLRDIYEYGSNRLAAAQRKHGGLVMLCVAMYRFKSINARYGHETGDEVLKEVAKRLCACTRREDLVGRLGGDEFVIQLSNPEADPDRAAVVA